VDNFSDVTHILWY